VKESANIAIQESAIKKQQKVTEKVPCSYKEVVKLQSTNGSWSDSAEPFLSQFLRSAPVSSSISDKTVLMTLLALCVLESVFGDEEAEWQMIAKKAKLFLQKQGGLSSL
jgi:hypothetical protein